MFCLGDPRFTTDASVPQGGTTDAPAGGQGANANGGGGQGANGGVLLEAFDYDVARRAALDSLRMPSAPLVAPERGAFRLVRASQTYDGPMDGCFFRNVGGVLG